ncbi:hypothetical protein [Mucilaginibacter lacusdianchii]|uniref:hypothetical protein n=1 Tax=Mucilaginibacter lacusdianchii TaxID=2684211 RepID=UPI00131DF8A0|nr:hypothetical protein [Mucilaginibacter sp. JXJ CY 39]
MNAYQQKWIDVLNNAQIKDWKISAKGDDILIDLPLSTHVSTIMENLPDVVATLSLDITLPKERLKFILRNGAETHEYLLNPTDTDLNTAK